MKLYFIFCICSPVLLGDAFDDIICLVYTNSNSVCMMLILRRMFWPSWSL